MNSFEEWQEVREKLIQTYCERVLPRDLQVAAQPRLPLHIVFDVLFRTIHTALLIYTGADPTTQREMLVLVKRIYTLMHRELPAPEFEEISTALFGAWRHVLAQGERMN
jgi:hypothetical protein